MVPTEGSEQPPDDRVLAGVDRPRAESDQDRSGRDQVSADRDQAASDLEQAASDREQAAPADSDVREASRADRVEASAMRLATAAERARTAAERLGAATARDLRARVRDLAAAERDRAAEALEAAGANQPAEQRLSAFLARAAADREQAAADRAMAAADRDAAAHDRVQAAMDLRHAYRDDLTGALRRDMGELALQHEIDRARRGDGRLVLAFVDVDELKSLNDREGHRAGDALLTGVVHTMRAKLRSFDPIVRYGGDEFVCALTSTSLSEARERFVDIGKTLARDYDEAAISVGVVELHSGESLDDLVSRGDAALYAAKRRLRRGAGRQISVGDARTGRGRD